MPRQHPTFTPAGPEPIRHSAFTGGEAVYHHMSRTLGRRDGALRLLRRARRAWGAAPISSILLAISTALGSTLVAGGCSDAPSGPIVATFGDYSLEPNDVAELVASVESVPADVNTVAAIAVMWADFTALSELLADDPQLRGLDFDPSVVPVAEQEMINALRASRSPTDTVVSSEELLEAYEATDPPARIEASHILIAYPMNAGDAERAEARAQANELVARIRAGESFARLAREFSDDPGTAESGGQLGEFSPGEMLPQVDSALAELDVGRIAGPVETHLGVHVVRLDQRRVLGMADAADELRAAILLQRRLSADSALVALVEGDTPPRMAQGALELVHELAARPAIRLSDRAADRTVISHPDRDLTLGDVREELMRQGVEFTQQVARASEEEINNYLAGLLRRRLLVARARADDLALEQTRIDELRDAARNQLLAAGRDLGLDRLDPAPGEAIEQAIARSARLALERVLQGGTGGLVLGPMTEPVRRGRTLVLDDSALGAAVIAIGNARMNRSASPLEQADTVGISR